MKKLIKTKAELLTAGRWDIDFHLPAEGILKFPKNCLVRVDEVANVVRDKRDPTKFPNDVFQYVDISAVDISIGAVSSPQEVEGRDAPSRARKAIRAFDLVVSTCRPTRGAIAVIPLELHNQIASTGFSVIRAFDTVNPLYLHFALRLPSTLEQFRKWSTGSSYPAILDSDVKKTLIPLPDITVQDQIAKNVGVALRKRALLIQSANVSLSAAFDEITASLQGNDKPLLDGFDSDDRCDDFELAKIHALLSKLPALTIDEDLLELDGE